LRQDFLAHCIAAKKCSRNFDFRDIYGNHMSGPLNWIDDELTSLERGGLVRRRRQVTTRPGARCIVEGRELVNFASNDYLNLAHDPRVIAAAQRALAESGVGATASALISGRSGWHVALEESLARFERQPSAVLFPTGFAANVGTICALAEKDDVIFSDQLNHASLIDGCRLSRARVCIYRHDDLNALRSGLHNSPASGRRVIVTDSVFSMDGDLAPLPDLCELAEQFDAILIVDEAHATGVLGANGRGVAELQGVEDRVAIRVGTLSKGVGTLGGFVAGPQNLIDWLWNRARTQIFSTALPPSICAAAAEAIRLIETEPERRQRLLQSAAYLRRKIVDSGIETVAHAVGPIVPVILHTPERAVQAARQIEEQGFLVGAIRPPSVPQGTSRLRITLSSAHDAADIDRLIRALLAARCGPI
jgi:8-amino-7-oxononanoate synthase